MTRGRLWICLLANACCNYMVRCTPTTGISLVGGGPGSPELLFGVADLGDTPSLAVFDDPTDMSPARLEVKRGDTARASFAADVSVLPNVIAKGDLSVESVSFGASPQWRLYDLDTFDVTDSGEWSVNTKGFCGVPEDKFLGGHCKFGASTTIRRYANLPPHKKIRIRARVHFFDDWEGESVILQVDNNPMWAHSHDWCPGFLKDKCIQLGMDACGKQTPDKLSVKAEVSFVHTYDTMDVAFTSSIPLGTDPCVKSWGIDDVAVELL